MPWADPGSTNLQLTSKVFKSKCKYMELRQKFKSNMIMYGISIKSSSILAISLMRPAAKSNSQLEIPFNRVDWVHSTHSLLSSEFKVLED